MNADEPLDAIDDLGAYLRGKRTGRHLSLSELSSQTRIGVRFLESLEENRFDQLPNPVSARGFLRAYARALSLSEESILLRFTELTEGAAAPTGPEEEGSPVIRPAPEGPTPSLGNSTKMGIPLALLAIVLLFLWLVSKGVDSGDGVPETASLPEASEPGPSVPVPEPDDQSRVPKTLLPRENPLVNPPPDLMKDHPTETPETFPVQGLSAGAQIGSRPIRGEDLLLEIEALETTWLEVGIDDEPVREALLQPGEKVRWKARDRFILTLGNAGGVNVTYNGKPVEPLGPSGKVVREILLVR